MRLRNSSAKRPGRLGRATGALLLILFVHAAALAQSTSTVCAARPPAGSPSLLYRDGSQLCWSGAPLRMVGYGGIDLATRNGYDFTTFMNILRFVDSSDESKRHGVNLTRVWAMGTANYPDCYHTASDLDPHRPSMTMPFQMLPGETCSAEHLHPKYDVCTSDVACRDAAGLNPPYVTRMRNILAEARKNGILVELMLFDAYFMGRQNNGQPLYAGNPWSPVNNNMGQNRFRKSPGSTAYGACNKLYRSTGTSDTTDDAFPEFYDICSDTSSSEKCDQTLNCLGLIQKGYVNSMVDLVRGSGSGSDNVFFEIMNRSTFDKHDSTFEGFDLVKFKRWNDVVGRWIKCRGDGNCANTRGDYLVLAEVGLADYSDLACTKSSDCPVNPVDAFAMPNVDIINLQGYTWENSPGAPGPCKTAMTAVNRFKKPVIIDTDSAYERVDKCNVEKWAREVRSCGVEGQVHFDQLDGLTFGYPSPKQCGFHGTGSPQLFQDFDERYLDCHALDTLGAGNPTFLYNIVTTAPSASCPNSVTSSGAPTWCNSTCQ